MAIIPVPAGAEFTSISFEIDFPAQVNRSEWSRGRKVVGLPGLPKWYIKGVLKLQATESAVRLWRSFKMRLRGAENSFKMPVCTDQIASANPTISAIGSDGKSLTLNSAANLKDGMFGTVVLTASGHHRLFVLTADPVGNVIAFEPELSEAPSIGAAVEFRNPYALVAQIETRGGWEDGDGVAAFMFDAEEAY